MTDSLKSRSRVVYGLLAVAACIFLAVWFGQSHQAPVGVDDPTADDMLTRASSACLVEITNLEEFDERPSDGDYWVKASFEVIEATGDIPEFLYIVKESGGHLAPPPANTPPSPPPRLTHNTLSVGEKHWFVFGTEGDGSQLPYGMTGWWPAGAKDLPNSVIAAVKEDRFKWHPVYDTTCRLIHEWHEDKSAGKVTVRVRNGDEQLWSRQFDGTVNPDHPTTNVWNYGTAYEMEWPEGKPFLGLFVKLVQTLPSGSEFNVPAGAYRVDYALDMKTSETLAIWVATNVNEAWNKHAFRQYDADTGRVIIAADMKNLDSGGVELGGETENWRRKTETRFDPESGEQLSHGVFRYGLKEIPGTTYTEYGWVPVEASSADD